MTIPLAPEPLVLPIGLAQQWVIFLTAFFVKPLYMALSLLLVLALRRSLEPELVQVRWALVLFLIGEGFCTVNYLFASGDSDALEIGHQVGMIGMNVFLPWGLLTLLDRRALRFSHPGLPCALGALCRRCWKREPVACGVHRLFVFSLPMLAVLALMPLTAPLQPLRIVVSVFEHPVLYESTRTIQWLEFRLYPVLAALFLLSAWIVLLGGVTRIRTAQPLFFASFGFLGFALLRFFFSRSYQPDLFWSATWEELTELFTIAAVGMLLWVFRNPLKIRLRFAKSSATAPADLPRDHP